MSGKDVLAWQKFLDRHGTFGIGNDADGKFGILTESFTKTWQEVRKLPITGQLDETTLRAAVIEGFIPVEIDDSKSTEQSKPVSVDQSQVDIIISVGDIKVWGAGPGLPFWFLSEMTIDADGGYRTYHPDSKSGLDALGNGGKPGNWWALVTDNGKPSGNPIVQGPGDPAPGYYISKTSLENKTYKSTDPRRYVDSESVPYMVLPPQVKDAGGAKLGDMATVINTKNMAFVHAIFADIGPRKHIGEASIQCAKAIGVASNPRTGGTSSKSILYIVYPGSGNGQPRSNEVINNLGSMYFKNLGGINKIKSIMS